MVLRFYIVLMVTLVLCSGCASRFEDRLEVRDAAVEDAGRTGIPIKVEFSHPIDAEPGTPSYRYMSEFYEKFNKRVRQGLINSGYFPVDDDAPYIASVDLSCEHDQWAFWWTGKGGPDNPIQLIFVTIPFTLMGGPMTSENRWSCDARVLEGGATVVSKSYVEDWKSYGNPFPPSILYMPFMGAFGAHIAMGEEKMFDILAAKVVTNLVEDVNGSSRLSARNGVSVPRVVVFPEHGL